MAAVIRSINSSILPFCLAAISTICLSCSPSHPPSAALIFDLPRADLPSHTTARLGGPLTPADVDQLESVARTELRKAFEPFRIELADSERGFWRVRVVREVVPQSHALAGVGESVALGPLGGGGFVDLSAIADQVARFAPADASRAGMIDALGRGVGRVAVHEFGHQILGPASAHNDLDGHAYENGSPERFALYYADLRWTTWQHPLAVRLGVR